ncbi:MAG: tRNA preQ1(34) S-adenosylmethionine ribosyltransferase-isomerase QueA [Rhodospirillales bacterium]
MNLDDFDFPLPTTAIAQRPVVPRDAARLLVVGRRLAHHRVDQLPELLRPGDRLVINDTRVLPLRLFGQRDTVAVEATLIEDLGDGRWRALARPGRRLRLGDSVRFGDEMLATVAGKAADGSVELAFKIAGSAFAAALQRCGAAPLPPYIRRRSRDERDLADYQTVYASRPGAVAAPTAGLHFTPELLARLVAAGIAISRLTLHVGPGTFLPVKVSRIADHVMQAEYGEIGAEAAAEIEATRAAGGRVIAVGTTACRLLETAAARVGADDEGKVRPFAGATSLFITPGYRFRVIDLLLTNFHLPRSTLFMLVAAFVGLERMRSAYGEALASGYRFHSYGDASLLLPADAG